MANNEQSSETCTIFTGSPTTVYLIPYPALLTLLLSSNNLITLNLSILLTGYTSPEAMVMDLAAFPKL